jgi:haloacetate dehalogenase
MARDLVGAMERLGHPRFLTAGHDRGGRVAYRLALDQPERVERLAVLDILPTETVWARADDRLALSYWPWSMLAQPEPLPERMLTQCAESVVADALDQWGSNPGAFPAAVRVAYSAALRDPSHAHAICEEYRAAAGIDREHDRSDRAAGRRIHCPVLVLWSATGPLATWYASEGGPLTLWREWASMVEGHAIEGGHFFPEEVPGATADALRRFFEAKNSGAPP